MSESGFGKFGVNAWTPERTALWNTLDPQDRRELEAWVAQGSDAPVPDKWRSKSEQLRGVKTESVVPTRIINHMTSRGWTAAVIDSVYSKYYRRTA